MKRICPNCGKEVSPEEEICPQCGFNLYGEANPDIPTNLGLLGLKRPPKLLQPDRSQPAYPKMQARAPTVPTVKATHPTEPTQPARAKPKPQRSQPTHPPVTRTHLKQEKAKKKSHKKLYVFTLITAVLCLLIAIGYNYYSRKN
ncbi:MULTISPECIES: zinc-ribbon domain-containing protein [Lactobacillus]|uniref:Zinc-ribbon domain-containing protein n=1 Tax=Lactobacillus xujianguonis TaxID=2495899 RepID=A0A437SVR7_9LACO|nr:MULTISPECIES: zinc ribbon domain-containing protein [Lactobacillus]RVU71018.1 zinc-ribbon domain-containing protein [Lactobacillus xujianguonis]RVU73912.1 zinc-ribbon domain-containing protein [Lactobacillus xujianguonis]